MHEVRAPTLREQDQIPDQARHPVGLVEQQCLGLGDVLPRLQVKRRGEQTPMDRADPRSMESVRAPSDWALVDDARRVAQRMSDGRSNRLVTQLGKKR